MPSDRAILIRDRLNKMIDELTAGDDDQEGHILSCCIALAVEEVEKWMYHGEFTPSVVPYKESKEWVFPVPPEMANDNEFEGPPWDRKRKNKINILKTWKAIRGKAEKTPLKIPEEVVLAGVDPPRWSKEMHETFASGNRSWFSILVQRGEIEGCPFVSMTDASKYTDRMIREYPHLWESKFRKKSRD